MAAGLQWGMTIAAAVLAQKQGGILSVPAPRQPCQHVDPRRGDNLDDHADTPQAGAPVGVATVADAHR
jgi:hypothetical protein